MTTFKIDYIERSFGNNETIEAVIKNCNKNEALTTGLLLYLMKQFNILNNNNVPIMGQPYKIPIIKIS